MVMPKFFTSGYGPKLPDPKLGLLKESIHVAKDLQ
jgi:hypothetical protein